MNGILAEWIAKAEGDFTTAQREMRVRRKPNYDAVCFHSQQCVEKYLKAFLISKRIEPPRTHNLVELVNLCLAKDGTFEMFRPALESLNAFSVTIRYPRAFAARQDARDAVKAMKQVRDFVRGKLKAK